MGGEGRDRKNRPPPKLHQSKIRGGRHHRPGSLAIAFVRRFIALRRVADTGTKYLAIVPDNGISHPRGRELIQALVEPDHIAPYGNFGYTKCLSRTSYSVARHQKPISCTSSSAVEQPVYTGSVGGSIPSSCTTLITLIISNFSRAVTAADSK